MFRDIIYECNSTEDVIEAEKIGEKYGWVWESNLMYGDINSVGYLVFSVKKETDKKVLYYRLKQDIEDVLIFLRTGNNGDYKIAKSITDLKSMLSGMKFINYNEPRKLVYENKILKFNQYK